MCPDIISFRQFARFRNVFPKHLPLRYSINKLLTFDKRSRSWTVLSLDKYVIFTVFNQTRIWKKIISNRCFSEIHNAVSFLFKIKPYSSCECTFLYCDYIFIVAIVIWRILLNLVPASVGNILNSFISHNFAGF